MNFIVSYWLRQFARALFGGVNWHMSLYPLLFRRYRVLLMMGEN